MNILRMSKLTQEILKLAYRKACAKYHPDRNPAGLEMMKSINVAYDTLKDLPDEEIFTPGTGENHYFDELLNEAINIAMNLDGVSIEVCGNWVWLSGNTKPHKDAIKSSGYFWASKKMMWYFRPAEYKSSNRGSWDIDRIRESHGSVKVDKKESKKIY